LEYFFVRKAYRTYFTSKRTRILEPRFSGSKLQKKARISHGKHNAFSKNIPSPSCLSGISGTKYVEPGLNFIRQRTQEILDLSK